MCKRVYISKQRKRCALAALASKKWRKQRHRAVASKAWHQLAALAYRNGGIIIVAACSVIAGEKLLLPDMTYSRGANDKKYRQHAVCRNERRVAYCVTKKQ